jgi:Flp pilus assembly protein TadG
VEFALVMIPMIVLLLGSIEYGWYFYSTQAASSAARETARRLAVGDCIGSAAETYASNQAHITNLKLTYGTPATDPTDLYNFSGATNPTTLHVGDPLRVLVTADAKIIEFVPLPHDGALRKVVNTRVEDTSPGPSC